ncbi:DUF1491 family protein [Litorimonas sp.]|uniref:DUF1491 family protein n=1 Tax=Litorimonas sp. TaxID=1892381 RepID=UPI003A86BBFD
MSPRLKSEFWVGALLRRAQSQGGFATILRKGDPDAGIVLIVFRVGQALKLYAPERNFEGQRVWWPYDMADQAALDSRVNRRVDDDPDIWVIEIESDVAPEALIGEPVEQETREVDPAEAAAQALFRGR